ncbi:uncharacterized protein LOC141902613 [Tubulanus polymorphus]|uniref:uncharacterized protein LOC141902613 n=1 Tax=Tubulanus polymorphus TaxID=672921 RepID=UPI003DA20EA7
MAVQMMLFDEVKLEWTEAPPGIEVPDRPTTFNHHPKIQVFTVKCKDEETAKSYKSSLERSHQSLEGLNVIGTGRDRTYSCKVNAGVPITVPPTVVTTEQQLNVFDLKLNKLIEDVFGRIDEIERSSDYVIDSLMIRKVVQTNFDPDLVKSLPPTDEQADGQLHLICAQWDCSDDAYMRYIDDNIVKKRYIKCDGDEVQGLDTDIYGYLYILVLKKTKLYVC